MREKLANESPHSVCDALIRPWMLLALPGVLRNPRTNNCAPAGFLCFCKGAQGVRKSLANNAAQAGAPAPALILSGRAVALQGANYGSILKTGVPP